MSGKRVTASERIRTEIDALFADPDRELGRSREHGEPPTGPSFLWERISSLMAIHWGTGRIESGGFAIYPKPDRFPTE